MKHTYPFALYMLLWACGPSANTPQHADSPAVTQQPAPPDTLPSAQPDTAPALPTRQPKLAGIPPDGTYRYDMAFAEHRGATMGEKVTVIINGNHVKVVYQGDGKLATPRGTVLTEGQVIKHKNGVFIITNNPADATTDVYGGCSGGPHVVDFSLKKYHTC